MLKISVNLHKKITHNIACIIFAHKYNKKKFMNNLSGSITALVTPFNQDQSIDFNAFENLVQFQLMGGIKGLVVAGTTGEGYALEKEELVDLIKCAKSVAGDKVPVIAGTGTLVTRKTIELSQAAQNAGADGFLVINPYYNKASEEFLVQHFADVANNVDAPIMLYNVPSRTGYNMSANLILELAHRHKNITSVKEASGNLAQVAEIINNAPSGFSVFSGDDALAYSIINLGGRGCVSVVANLIPAAFSQLCDLALKGEHELAQQLHHKFLDLFNANFIETNPVPVKTALARHGLVQNVFRAPFYPWKNEVKMNEYFSVLEKSGVDLGTFILQEN